MSVDRSRWSNTHGRREPKWIAWRIRSDRERPGVPPWMEPNSNPEDRLWRGNRSWLAHLSRSAGQNGGSDVVRALGSAIFSRNRGLNYSSTGCFRVPDGRLGHGIEIHGYRVGDLAHRLTVSDREGSSSNVRPRSSKSAEAVR